jgi:hypothetical protein
MRVQHDPAAPRRPARLVGGRRIRAALAALVLLGGLCGVAGFGVACSRPLDFNAWGPAAPGTLTDEWLQRSEISFAGHAVIGTVLGAAGCDGGAVALQWLKAAWHASGPEEEAQAAQGLRRAVALAGSPHAVEAVVCDYFPLGVLPSQSRALRAAGMGCPPMRRG